MEMVDRAGGYLLNMMDYFTSAVTPEYLESMWEEFQILGDVELVVLGLNDPSWPTSAFSPFLHVGTPETERCSHAAECQCLSDFDKLLCSLGKVLLCGVAV